MFDLGGFWEMYFCMLVCFVLYIVIFNAFIGFGVIFCIYEHILKIFLYIFEKGSEV